MVTIEGYQNLSDLTVTYDFTGLNTAIPEFTWYSVDVSYEGLFFLDVDVPSATRTPCHNGKKHFFSKTASSPLPKKTLRRERLDIRFTQEEIAFLRRIAREHDKSVSQVIRAGVLRLRVEDIPERPRVPEVNRQLYLELAQVSEALTANSSGIDPESLQRLEGLLSETRLLLLGIPSGHTKSQYL